MSRHPLLGRRYQPGIGPASSPVDLAAFAESARASLGRVDQALDRIKAQLGESGLREAVERRCSLADLYEEQNCLYESPRVRTRLNEWHQQRTSATDLSLPLPPASDEEEDEPVEDPRVVSEEMVGGEGVSDLSGAVESILEEADRSRLGIVSGVQWTAFVRKTRLADYNVLPLIRTTPARSQPPTGSTSTSASPVTPVNKVLSQVLLTIKFHSIPRKVGAHGRSFPVQAQTLHVLGSTTLSEIRHALLFTCEGIPDVYQDAPQDCDSDEEEGERPRVKRWRGGRRKAGCAFVAEGVVYADAEPGRLNYAETLLDSIKSVNWSAPASTRRRTRSDSSPDRSNSIAPNQGDPSPNPTRRERTVPSYRAGSSIATTATGGVEGLRAGQAYWFLHQGNCEHIWSIDSIRLLRPDEPQPLEGSGCAPYPITTFLSRSIEPRCRICDRDPAEVVTTDDEVAGEAVCEMCWTCFELTHGGWSEGGVESGVASDGTRVIPRVLAE